MRCRRVHHKKEPYDIMIDRSGKWGSPFTYKKYTKAKYIVSSRKESIELYKTANRNDMAEQEQKELDIIMEFLPMQMSDDDIIERIEISSEGIIFFIKLQTFPKNMNSYPVIKLIFRGVEKFYLEGELYGCASIIIDMESKKIENYVQTQISSSLGTSGTILSNKIEISL